MTLDRLRSALWQTPIPTSPLPHNSYQEALGLNLLALALRLEHVDRMTEALTLVDSTHMTRSVSIDINLTVLTPDQIQALRTDPNAVKAPETVWLPVARQARTDQAPVVVRDATNVVLPRATHEETAGALIQGMSKAFRMFLEADPRTGDPGETLYSVRHELHRSRWLIQAAIANMIDKGVQPPRSHAEQASRRGATDSESIRERAEQAINDLFPEDSAFLRLLDIASSEYLLVTEVPTNKPQVFMQFDAPVMPARSQDLRDRATIRRGLTPRHEFTVRYQTVIPRAVDSYHVTIEVPSEIAVRRFFLTSDVDGPALSTLVDDIRAVADEYDELKSVSPKLLEQELQSIGSRLAEFGRRRQRDLDSFKTYLEECYAGFTNRRPTFPENGQLIGWLAEFSRKYEADHYRKLADGVFTAPMLRQLADDLESSDVDKDLYVDNDPRDNAGHAHWRRRPFGSDPQSVEPVEANLYIALVDDPPSLATNVSKMLLAVTLLVLAFGVILQPDLFRGILFLDDFGDNLKPAFDERSPVSSADAIVTVLLLVPGLLLARLDIPSARSVLGQLRLFPRYIAYLSMIIAGALALFVAAAQANALGLPFEVAIWLLAVLAASMVVNNIISSVKRRSRVPFSTVSPNWLITELTGAVKRRKRDCVVNFSTLGRDARV
ncbi:hypothetical protein LWC34_22815 [Kibdelosporangium philippinense]|uniref:Uncharacterized protein n=1 Tax=Kibdelosporangium philippinense TaxID=211113 RepID=A0ABS8ZIH5_9PSEU|nr:hypothetical protein [Kibdelosporangium philippinense]MCE7005637.1 hypothetical protein [Kibdelosporangium philippinense]